MKVEVFDIQHFSTGDGPGIRTTVFFSGCNLRCPWCHNPEAMYAERTLLRSDEIVARVLSDRMFYEKSGGGVTLSGGEPLMQFSECVHLLEIFKGYDIHTIIDTALSVENMDFKQIIPLCDCFFVDIKTASPYLYERFCKGKLETVLDNLHKLLNQNASIVIRIPLIPGFNMDDESIDDIIKLLKPLNLPVSLLPFHRMGTYKYTELGIEYSFAETLPPDLGTVKDIRKKFISNGIMEANV